MSNPLPSLRVYQQHAPHITVNGGGPAGRRAETTVTCDAKEEEVVKVDVEQEAGERAGIIDIVLWRQRLRSGSC